MLFDGRNKRGHLQWTTRCEVTSVRPGEFFEFKPRTIMLGTVAIPFPIPTTWSYGFQVINEESTLVAETWTIGPWPAPAISMLRGYRVDGINVVEMQTRNLRITLQNLKHRLEEEHRLVTRADHAD